MKTEEKRVIIEFNQIQTNIFQSIGPFKCSALNYSHIQEMFPIPKHNDMTEV